MSTPRDDDALSWGGDDDPTLDVGEKAAPGRAAAAASEPDSTPADVADPRGPEPLQTVPEPLQPRSSSAAPTARHPEADDIESDDDEPDAAHPRPLGNAGLIGIGMVAATFLLFAVGWLVAGLQLQGLGLPIPAVTLIALTIGAALAPLVWFVAVLALTRSWRTWQRFLLLILGIVLLVPWPFLSLGAFA
ncbi:DNA polymerase III subunit gamma/tau [Microbacterium sp. 22296]|uniref:DNA polymerase III subunit gamma/tau n=1 Tax=Microbacterium sp. 22296 TaxID=3453903 RepID=UPI003F853F19